MASGRGSRLVHESGDDLLDLQAGRPKDGASRAPWGQREVAARGPGGAALCRTAALDQRPARVRILLRLQRGGREYVRSQPAQLSGCGERGLPVIQLDQ